MSQADNILDVSWKGILKVAIIVVCFYILFLIKDILVWFLFALIISILFNPAIDFFQKRKVPRLLATLLVYFAVFGAFTFLIYLVVPLFMTEIDHFLKNFPQFFEKISPPLRALGFQAFQNTQALLKALGDALAGMTDNIFSAIATLFGGFFSALFIITTAIFLSLEEKVMEKLLVLIFPKKYEVSALSIWIKCQKKVSGWFGVRLLACAFVGVLVYIALLIFNVKYPATLGFLAGAMNFIPFIGPLLTGALIFLIVAPAGLMKGILVLVVFVLIQYIENNILSPILTKKFVGLPPALVLVAVVIGGRVWGVLGAILIIPLAGILFEFLKEFLQKRKVKDIAIV